MCNFLFQCHTVVTGGGRVLSFLILAAIYSFADKYTVYLVLIMIPVLPGQTPLWGGGCCGRVQPGDGYFNSGRAMGSHCAIKQLAAKKGQRAKDMLVLARYAKALSKVSLLHNTMAEYHLHKLR